MSKNRASNILKDPYAVLRRPVLTEKTHDQAAMAQDSEKEQQARYTFEVHPKATKHQIRRAIEGLFGVQVESVNTMVSKPKPKLVRNRRNARPGHTRIRKKASVRLKPGSKRIELI